LSASPDYFAAYRRNTNDTGHLGSVHLNQWTYDDVIILIDDFGLLNDADAVLLRIAR